MFILQMFLKLVNVISRSFQILDFCGPLAPCSRSVHNVVCSNQVQRNVANIHDCQHMLVASNATESCAEKETK